MIWIRSCFIQRAACLSSPLPRPLAPVLTFYIHAGNIIGCQPFVFAFAWKQGASSLTAPKSAKCRPDSVPNPRSARHVRRGDSGHEPVTFLDVLKFACSVTEPCISGGSYGRLWKTQQHTSCWTRAWYSRTTPSKYFAVEGVPRENSQYPWRQ